MSRSLFVYWTIDVGRAAEALACVRQAQARLRRRWPELDARLWQREQEGAAQATLMATYTLSAGIDEPTQAQIESALTTALAGLPAGPRHVEVFRPA